MKKIDQIIAGLQLMKECGHCDVRADAGVICVIATDDICKDNISTMKENCWLWNDDFSTWDYEIDR